MPLPLVFVATALAATTPTAAQDAHAEQEIIALETELGRAMIHRDVAALERIVGDDWICQSATGVSDKKSFVGDVASGRLVVTQFVLHDIHVKVVGDTAYLMGADDEQSSYAGSNNSGTYNWLDVWTKRGGRWVSIATQITRAAPKS
jgi:ketosteroid isomerase-like protein